MERKPPHPYPYCRRRHLPFIVRVPSDWLSDEASATTALIVERLERAADLQVAGSARARSIAWALTEERRRL